MAICDATHRCKLAESLAQILLSVRIMARHLLGFAPFRFVIRLPMKFSRYSRSALSGACDIWLWISRERLLSGDKNLSSRMHEWPVAEAWKGGHAPARAAPRGRLSSPFASIPNGRCGFGKVFGNIFEIFQKYFLAGGFWRIFHPGRVRFNA